MKVGAHFYKIIETDHIDECGKVDKERGIMYIQKDLIPSEKVTSIIHESFHIINNELSHTDIEFLSQAITQLFLENKTLWYKLLKKK